MALRLRTVLSLLSVLSFFVIIAESQIAGTQCYVLNGDIETDMYRCNNATTGHSTCCHVGDTCYSNGICQGDNEGYTDYLREGCTDPTWKDPACLDKCVQYANDSTAGIRWCGTSITSSTEYCCDTGADGIGSFACCNNSTQEFKISPAPTIVAVIGATAQVTYPPSSSTTSSSSSPTSATSTSSSAAATSTSSTSKSSVNGAAIGAGVGVPVGLIALAAIGFFFWRRHSRESKASKTYEMENPQHPGYTQAPYADNSNGPYEAPPYNTVGGAVHGQGVGQNSPKAGYYPGTPYDPPQQQMVQELPNTQRQQVHEIGPAS